MHQPRHAPGLFYEVVRKVPSPSQKGDVQEMMKQQFRPTATSVKGQAIVKVEEHLIEEILKAAGLEALD